MTATATLAPATTTPKAARKTAAPKVAAEVPVTMEELEAGLRAQWDAATTGETTAKNVLDAAKIAWENTRVIKCRIGFAAAMLVPNAEGQANLLNAARILGTDPEGTKAERTKAAKSRKNSLRLYVAAGVALDELGMAYRTTEPDAEEREVVREAFKPAPKEETTTPKGDGSEGEGEGEEGTIPPADPQDPVTQAAVIAAAELYINTVKRFTRDHGFAAVVADNLLEAMAEVAALIESHKVDGGDS